MSTFLRKAMLMVGVTAILALPAPAAETAARRDLPTNKWFRLSERGSFQKMVWVPELNAAVRWTPRKVKKDRKWGLYQIFTANDGRWTTLEGGFPPNFNFPPLGGDSPGVYLPALKKLFFVRPNSTLFSRGQVATVWALDLAGKKFSIQGGKDLWMCDKSWEFNPSAFSQDWRVPFWTDLVYDPINGEAVLFGGAGTWGRISKEKEEAGPLDWIYDETMEPKRVRRLTKKEGQVMARRWYPAHVGTWTFSEKTKTWTPTPQPLREQPSGRIKSQMAYDSAEKKIVLFGGDNRARVLGDTWIYDCTTRAWKEAKPKVSPPPRAFHALIYVPEQKVVLLAGGYTGGWKELKDVWAYSVPRTEWIRLATDLPGPAKACGGYYDPSIGAAVVTAPGMCAIKLDLAAAPKAEPIPFTERSAWHAANGRWPGKMPEEWLTGKLAPDTSEDGRKRIQAMPANQWVNSKPPAAPIERNWGSYVYDVKTHRVFAWGGGHSTYPGSDINEYDVLANRWSSQAEPAEYYPYWKHRMSVGMPGVSFFGHSVLPCHARKSYGVDPVSRSVITWPGDVYSIEHHLVLSSIGRCPPRPWTDGYYQSHQPAYVTAPHGLYAYHQHAGVLYRANVKAGRWDRVAAGGPKTRSEWVHLACDTKRDRLILFPSRQTAVWAFDIRTKTWAKEDVQGAAPPLNLGDSAYVAPMDAVLLVFSPGKGQPQRLYFYKLGEHRWYAAPSQGECTITNSAGKDASPHYDPELGVIVRVGGRRFNSPIQVNLMRLVPEELKLTPLPEMRPPKKKPAAGSKRTPGK